MHTLLAIVQRCEKITLKYKKTKYIQEMINLIYIIYKLWVMFSVQYLYIKLPIDFIIYIYITLIFITHK